MLSDQIAVRHRRGKVLAKSRRLAMRHKRYANCLVVAGILLFAVAECFAKDAKLQIHVKPDQAYVFVDGSTFGPGSRNISVHQEVTRSASITMVTNRKSGKCP